MTKEEYLLMCLMEECNEVSQRICKAFRFGLEEIQNSSVDEFKDNRTRIVYELTDLITVVSLISNHDFRYKVAVCQEKLNKLEKYMKYSIKLGIIKES